jgi:hypothetical protein
MVPVSLRCPQCHASAGTIRAWRAFAQIFYVCDTCEAAWTIDIEPPKPPATPTDDVIAKLKKALL